jgi:hypothetical protein
MHNTGFFFEPFLLILNFYTAVSATKIFVKFDARKAGLLLIMLVFGFGGNISKLYSALFKEQGYRLISRDEYAGISFLKRTMLPQDIVVYFGPLAEKQTIIKAGGSHRELFISGLTQRRVLIEGAGFAIQNGSIDNIWDKLREREWMNLIVTNDWKLAKEELKAFSIDYIWLEENEKFSFDWEKILKKVFSNKKVTIYEVICQPRSPL